MRPRIDWARTALSPRAANGVRATKALRSRMRRSRNGPTPDLICPGSSAQPIGFQQFRVAVAPVGRGVYDQADLGADVRRVEGPADQAYAGQHRVGKKDIADIGAGEPGASGREDFREPLAIVCDRF